MWNIEIVGFSVYFLFFNFVLYSFLGWIWESCFVSFQNKRWINRGFLNGPFIPLYGFGATLIYMVIFPIQERPTYVFVIGMLFATVLEYVTSYVMEKLFHAKWWDYSNYRYNFQGRVCMVASLFWGFLSLLMADVLQPLVNSIIELIPRKIGEIAGVAIGAAIITDLVITVIYTVQWEKKLEEMERIREEFTEYMESTRLFETKEEIKNRLEGLSVTGYMEGFQGFRAELDEKYDELSEMKEEIAERMNRIREKYQKRLSVSSFVEKRLLNAFPTMKLTKNTAFLTDMKSFNERIHRIKKEK